VLSGEGKTTVLRALALATSALLDRMIPISHDFLASSLLPSTVIANAFDIFQQSTLSVADIPAPSHTESSLHYGINSFYQSGHEVLLLLDAYHHVFNLDAGQAAITAGIQTAREVYYYSRTSGTAYTHVQV